MLGRIGKEGVENMREEHVGGAIGSIRGGRGDGGGGRGGGGGGSGVVVYWCGARGCWRGGSSDGPSAYVCV